jgi:hypothetical protein
VGADWLALAHTGDALDLLPLAHLGSVAGLPMSAVPEQAVRVVDRGKDLPFLLRHVAAAGAEVVVSGASVDLRGRLGRVGRDYVDVDTGTEVWSVPWQALRRVRVV